ncbi:flagellar brake protein [Caballeronia ptereochthonis]|uniref:Flagellar brake protein YcgR n=1 Tax=Caballeronia ptereochthonis TaxID=1777144 RepID=A0A158E336_9BURK|nr:flagellar brake protein [Caballeronia ptereochthonis]SAL01295.1 YcgR family protein [Caballeronia ptereochthonis]
MLAEPLPHTSDIEKFADDHERFARRAPAEISMCLRNLARRRDMLTVTSAQGQIITQLLEVDAREARIVFDWGGVESDNRALLKARQLYFKAAPDGVRVEFTTDAARAVTYEGRQAFEVSFPEKLYQFQRREYFRVPAPILDPFYAKGAYADGEAFRYEVHDLSLGGIALRTDTPRLAETEIGTVFNDVVLQLGPGAAFSVDLQLVSPRSVTTPRGDVRYVVGFRFTRLSGVAENVLQRLITRMEAKRRSLSA